MLDVPPEVSHLWGWFWQLDQTRQSSGFGGLPITYGEISAWARLTGQQPRPWEVAGLIEMDAARRSALSPPETGADTGLRNLVPTSDWRASMAAMDRMARAREAK